MALRTETDSTAPAAASDRGKAAAAKRRKRPVFTAQYGAIAAGIAFLLFVTALVGYGFKHTPVAFYCTLAGLFIGMVAGRVWFGGIRDQRYVDAMVAGKRFVHWRYEAEQWAAHLGEQRDQARRLTQKLAIGFGVGGALLALYLSVMHLGFAMWLYLPLPMAAFGAAIGGIAEVCLRLEQKRQKQMGGEVYIGPDGYYMSGIFWPWRSITVRLAEIGFEAGPPPQLRTQFIISGKVTYPRVERLPVPRGREKEAAALVNHIHKHLGMDG